MTSSLTSLTSYRKTTSLASEPDERTPLLALRQVAAMSIGHKRSYKRLGSTVLQSARSWWENFQDETWVKEQYPELDAKEVCKATERLESVITHGEKATDELFHKCLKFKSRAIESGTLLHFAIWVRSQAESAKGILQTLLDCLEDPKQIFLPAILPSGRDPPRVTFVYAVHLAAGLGLLDELQMLVAFAWNGPSESDRMPAQDYINLWACSALKKVTTKEIVEDQDLVYAYQAIHEATYAGHADVTIWLLANGANPCSENESGVTPLHFLALGGISDDLPAVVIPKTTQVVELMVEENDLLVAKADMHKYLAIGYAASSNPKAMIPLEVAVQSASKFPQECIGLLAPCLVNHRSYLADIKKIANVTPRGALNLIRTIAHLGKKDPHVLKCFRLSVQQGNSSDVIGSIFYTAPQAASEMLDLFEIEPIVEDGAHHPIPAHVSLWGLFRTLPMRCSYQTDTRYIGKLKVPSWDYRKFINKQSDGSEPPYDWQADFMPNVLHHSRKPFIKKVKVVTYLVPGLLDIDIVMALARLREDNAHVMDKKAVEGVIVCLWENLVSPRWVAVMAMMFYDLLALMTLAFFHHHVSHPAAITLSLAAIFGNVVRNFAEFGATLVSTLSKMAQFTDDPLMGPMWSPARSWFVASFVCPLLATLLNLFFLSTVSFQARGIQNKTHADSLIEKMCFSACLLISCLQFVVMWRFCTIGATIYTVHRTITSGAVNQTLFIFGLIFSSVTLILLVWSRGSDVVMILAAFRAWLFADGDGFNALGFNKGFTTQVIFSMVAAFFFNVMTLNIIIAVYGHEYDRAQENLKFMFLKGRAHYIASSILSSYIIPWKGVLFNRFLTCLAWFLMIASVCSSILIHSVLFAGLLMGCGQRLLSISLMQCDWYSPEGEDAQQQDRYLWLCCADDWQHWLASDRIDDGKANKEGEVDLHLPERRESQEKLSQRASEYNCSFGARITVQNQAEKPHLDAKISAMREEMDRIWDALESQVHQVQSPRQSPR